MLYFTGQSYFLSGDYFLAMISMVCLSVISTVFVIHVSARNEAVPRWVELVFLRYLACLVCMPQPRLQTRPSGQMLPESTTMECNLSNEDAGDERRANNRSGDDVAKGGICLPSSVVDDIHYLRSNIEDKNDEDLVVQQWKHIGKVIDRCLLWVFSMYALITSVVLICRAIGPEFIYRPLSE